MTNTHFASYKYISYVECSMHQQHTTAKLAALKIKNPSRWHYQIGLHMISLRYGLTPVIDRGSTVLPSAIQ